MTKVKAPMALLAGVLVLGACTQQDQGVAIGGATGAALGALIVDENRAAGATVGAILGAAAGAAATN